MLLFGEGKAYQYYYSSLFFGNGMDFKKGEKRNHKGGICNWVRLLIG